MATLPELVASVEAEIKDTAGRLGAGEVQACVERAIAEYSKVRPRLLDALLVGDGAKRRFAMPSGWVDEESRLLHYEWPIDDVPPAKHKPQGWLQVDRRGGEFWLLTVGNTLGADEQARIYFTGQHEATSIPTGNVGAIEHLAAAKCARRIANSYAQHLDTTHPEGDLIDYARLTDRWDRVEMKHLEAYANAMTGGEAPAVALITHRQRPRPHGRLGSFWRGS